MEKKIGSIRNAQFVVVAAVAVVVRVRNKNTLI